MWYVILSGPNQVSVTRDLPATGTGRRLGEWIGNERWVRKRLTAGGDWSPIVGGVLCDPRGLADVLLRLGRELADADGRPAALTAYVAAEPYLALLPEGIVAKFREAATLRLAVLAE
jgi:hypothetical protein